MKAIMKMSDVLKVMFQMFLFACLLGLVSGAASAQDSAAPAADNTKVINGTKTKPSPPQTNRKKTSRIGRSHEGFVSLSFRTRLYPAMRITSKS